MTQKIKSLLNTNAGYIALPRSLAEAILAEKAIENVASLYSLLLLEANYGNTRKQGNVLE